MALKYLFAADDVSMLRQKAPLCAWDAILLGSILSSRWCDDPTPPDDAATKTITTTYLHALRAQLLHDIAAMRQNGDKQMKTAQRQYKGDQILIGKGSQPLYA